MNKTMNKIEKLIAELCPEGVEFKELGDVVKLEKGKQLNKELLSEAGEYPAYNGGISYSGFTNSYNYNEHTIIISQGGASAGFVNFITKKFYANAHCYVVLPNQKLAENRFVFHFLKLNQEKLTEKQHGAGIPALKTTEILKLKIPIPPLAIQQEIVKILDTFTTLEAELEAELEARKKQYEYYREELLTFGDEIERKKIDEITEVFTGGEAPAKSIKGLIPNDVYKYPIYANGFEVYGYTDNYKISKDAVTISSIGANTGTVYFRKAYFTPIIRLKVLLPKTDNLLAKYLFYYLSSIKINSKKSSVPNMNADDVKKITIPVPPLVEQEHIVAILDKFDALVNDISVGLPAELNARRKQYEYYRNELLTFKPLEKEYAKQ